MDCIEDCFSPHATVRQDIKATLCYVYKLFNLTFNRLYKGAVSPFYKKLLTCTASVLLRACVSQAEQGWFMILGSLLPPNASAVILKRHSMACWTSQKSKWHVSYLDGQSKIKCPWFALVLTWIAEQLHTHRGGRIFIISRLWASAVDCSWLIRIWLMLRIMFQFPGSATFSKWTLYSNHTKRTSWGGNLRFPM